MEGKRTSGFSSAGAYGPVFSPDGRWIAYAARRPAESTRYSCGPRRDRAATLQVTSEGGASPAWAGRELFFVRRGRIYVLETSTEPTFQAGPARVLFEAPFEVETAPLRNYDVSRDGRRFVFVRGGSESVWREIHVNLGWAAELARLAPASRR